MLTNATPDTAGQQPVVVAANTALYQAAQMQQFDLSAAPITAPTRPALLPPPEPPAQEDPLLALTM